MIRSRQRPAILAGMLLFIILLGSGYSSMDFQTHVLAESLQTSCPLSTTTTGNMEYVQNCYYKVGIDVNTGAVTYAAIVNGRNQNITAQNGLLAEELDIGYGGIGHFTEVNVSIDTLNAPNNIEIGISGAITQAGSVILSGIVNMTFLANEPYFISSLSSSILTPGTHNSHDIANYVSNTKWATAWAGPGNGGETEVCTIQPATCTNYVQPENTFDLAPDIKSLIQSNGPTWGWIGTSASNATGTEGIGFLLLGFNSTSPNEAAITHYEIKGADVGDWEIEGTGVDPADHSSSGPLDPHALQYSSNLPQTIYASILVYLNAAPWSTFYNFVHSQPSIWKGAVVGSFLGSSEPYAAFAETNRSANLWDQNWYITNIATSASAPILSYRDAMLYFTGRNSSLSNNFPMKMFLNIDDSTNLDWNFGTPTTILLSNDGTNAALQDIWNNPTNGYQLSMTFSTKSNTDKINVTGDLVVTAASIKAHTISLQANLYQNNLDGNGPPSQYLNVTNSMTTNNLYWDYTNFGISILLPDTSQYLGGVTSHQNVGYLNLVNASSTTTYNRGTSFPFRFSVSFYDPISNFFPGYSENIFVPTVKFFTQPLGNASQVGFTEDNSRVFSDLLSANEFDSNGTIAAMQFIKPFSGNLEVYYAGNSANAVYVKFGAQPAESAYQFYDSSSKVFNFNIESPASSAALFLNSTGAITTTTTTTTNSTSSQSSSSSNSSTTTFTTFSPIPTSTTTSTTTTSVSKGNNFFVDPLSMDLIIGALVVAIIVIGATLISVNIRKR